MSEQQLYESLGPKAAKRFVTCGGKPLAFALVATEALHRQHIGHAFFDVAGGL